MASLKLMDGGTFIWWDIYLVEHLLGLVERASSSQSFFYESVETFE